MNIHHKTLKWALGMAMQGLLWSAHAWSAAPSPNDTLVKDLIRYYPNLSCKALAAKSDFNGNGFKFLRTEIPWYWDQLKQNLDHPNLISASVKEKFDNFQGFCAGDAHPENFAIQTNSSGKRVFGINDPDDANDRCPVLADFVRFLTAVKLSGKPADLNSLVQTYISALVPRPHTQDDTFTPSDQIFLSSGLGTASASADGSDDDAPDAPAPAGGGKSQEDCDDAHLNALAKILQIDAAKVKSCKIKIKTSGGSGGLVRYVLKYKNANGDKVKTEFKGTQAAGPSFMTGHDLSPELRYQKACLLEVQKLSGCKVVPVDDQPFLIRTKNDSDQAVSLASAGAQLGDILHNEAIALARLHRNNMKLGTSASAYAQALGVMNRTEISKLATDMAAKAQSSADSLKNLNPDFVTQCTAITRPASPSGSDTVRSRGATGAARVH